MDLRHSSPRMVLVVAASSSVACGSNGGPTAPDASSGGTTNHSTTGGAFSSSDDSGGSASGSGGRSSAGGAGTSAGGGGKTAGAGGADETTGAGGADDTSGAGGADDTSGAGGGSAGSPGTAVDFFAALWGNIECWELSPSDGNQCSVTLSDGAVLSVEPACRFDQWDEDPYYESLGDKPNVALCNTAQREEDALGQWEEIRCYEGSDPTCEGRVGDWLVTLYPECDLPGYRELEPSDEYFLACANRLELFEDVRCFRRADSHPACFGKVERYWVALDWTCEAVPEYADSPTLDPKTITCD